MSERAGDRRPTAAFLDRDGTLVVDRHYLSRPEDVELLPGAAEAVRLLNDARVPVVVVTNQSGIARGLFGPDDYERVRERLDELLAEADARVDASYYCPHHPDYSGDCECRKPGLVLFERALQDLGLPPEHALFVGDRLRDVLPARALGGRGVLVPSPDTTDEERERAAREFETAGSLLEVVRDALRPPDE